MLSVLLRTLTVLRDKCLFIDGLGWVGLGWVISVQMLVDWWVGLTERGVGSSWVIKNGPVTMSGRGTAHFLYPT